MGKSVAPRHRLFQDGRELLLVPGRGPEHAEVLEVGAQVEDELALHVGQLQLADQRAKAVKLPANVRNALWSIT
jgi:hypothetical protein